MNKIAVAMGALVAGSLIWALTADAARDDIGSIYPSTNAAQSIYDTQSVTPNTEVFTDAVPVHRDIDAAFEIEMTLNTGPITFTTQMSLDGGVTYKEVSVAPHTGPISDPNYSKGHPWIFPPAATHIRMAINTGNTTPTVGVSVRSH